MYKCKNCNSESEFLVDCCNEKMVCDACKGSGCLLCEEDAKFID